MRMPVNVATRMTRSTVRSLYPWWTRNLKFTNPATMTTLAEGDLPKLCINCKHYLPCDVHPSYGKCAKFILSYNINYYVTGEGVKTDHYHCSVARSSPYMCDYNGIEFEEKSGFRNKN